MIVEQQAAVYNGFQMCIEAVLEAQCRYYFSSPSPMNSLLLNEGLTRFQQRHGTCLQTQTPTEAMSMAQGVAQLGDIPFVSSNYTDFLSVQHLFHHFFQQEMPCVYAVVLYQEPEFLGATTLPYGFPCLQNPWPGSGFPIPHLMPSHASQIQKNVSEAFALADQLKQPVLLLLDPMLLSTTQNVQSTAYEPVVLHDALENLGVNFLRRAQQRHQAMSALSPRFLRRWTPEHPPEYAVLAMGAMGGWLLTMDWHENAVFVLDSLYPGVLGPLKNLLPSKVPVYVLEYDPGCLFEQLQQAYDLPFVSIKLPWERSAPVGLQNLIYAEIAAHQPLQQRNIL